jgi:RNA polymerase sigma-70 factor (ECF subfamily)
MLALTAYGGLQPIPSALRIPAQGEHTATRPRELYDLLIERRRARDTEDHWRELMIAAVAGDGAAYHELLVSLAPSLRAFVTRRLTPDIAADIEDVVQETLLAVHKQRGRYDPKRPIAPWVYAIARYKLIDHCRRRGRRGVEVPVEMMADFLAEEAPDPPVRDTEIGPLLAQLPPKQRDAVDLVKVQAMSVRDAARASGMSEVAVRVNVHRGIRALAALLRERTE